MYMVINSDGGTDPIMLLNPATLMCLSQASICIYPTPYIVSIDLRIEVVVDIVQFYQYNRHPLQ
jgi:hypothetical protein